MLSGSLRFDELLNISHMYRHNNWYWIKLPWPYQTLKLVFTEYILFPVLPAVSKIYKKNLKGTVQFLLFKKAHQTVSVMATHSLQWWISHSATAQHTFHNFLLCSVANRPLGGKTIYSGSEKWTLRNTYTKRKFCCNKGGHLLEAEQSWVAE